MTSQSLHTAIEPHRHERHDHSRASHPGHHRSAGIGGGGGGGRRRSATGCRGRGRGRRAIFAARGTSWQSPPRRPPPVWMTAAALGESVGEGKLPRNRHGAASGRNFPSAPTRHGLRRLCLPGGGGGGCDHVPPGRVNAGSAAEARGKTLNSVPRGRSFRAEAGQGGRAALKASHR